jgi:hypothetical protein
MKNNLKKEISDLLTGNKGKKGILVAINKEPGIFEVNGKEYNAKEFEELQKNYEKTVTFVPAKTKIQKT